MKLRYLLLFSPLAFCANAANAQIAIGTTTPSASAILDLTSTTQGLLPPRMNTSQMGAIATPAAGLTVFNSDSGAYCVYTGTAWVKMLTSISRPKDTTSIIRDADRNTSVAAGTSATDDKIHFQLGGTEYFTMNRGTLEWNNTNNSVYLGKSAGGTDPYVGVGSNVAVGEDAMANSGNGNWNVAIGRNALKSLASGNSNVAIGLGAGYTNNSTGNTFLGALAGFYSTGSGNVFLGENAGTNETGDDMLYIANTASSLPLVWGDFYNKKLRVNDSLGAKYFGMSNGAVAGYILRSDAAGNAAWTNPLSIPMDTLNVISDSDANTKIVTGLTNADDKIHFTLGGTERFTMSRGTLEFNNTGAAVYIGNAAGLGDNYSANTFNTAVGSNALQNANFNSRENVGIGYKAGQQITSGTDNTLVGTNAGNFCTSGNSNTALGDNALHNNGSGSNNTAIGVDAGLMATGGGNVFLGYQSGYNETGGNKLYIANSSTSTPLLYGDFSNKALTINDSLRTKYFRMSTGAANGYVLRSDAGGNASWASPLSIDTPNFIADADGNTMVAAGNASSTNDQVHFTLGGKEYFTMSRATLEFNNSNGSVYIGNASGNADTYTGNGSNTGIGRNSLQNATSTGGFNVAVGALALQQATTGQANASVGVNAGVSITTGSNNTVVGGYALSSNSVGNNNVVVGNTAGANNTGSNNVFLGYEAGKYETADNKLYIANNSTSAPLIYGDFAGKTLGLNGSVGIGINAPATPSGMLEVTGGAVLNTGVFGSSAQVASSGAGTRMYFNPRDASFRAGGTSGTQWDAASRGLYSASFGLDNTASGDHAFATGINNLAAGDDAFACGKGDTASGGNAIALGIGNRAASYGETVLGVYATNYAANNTTAINGSDRLFNIGNGGGAFARADAFTVLKNGRIGIGTSSPTKAKLQVEGNVSASLSFAYFNGNNQTGTGSGTFNFSIYASDRIAGLEFNAFSDARIKHIIARSNSAADLATLMKLRITDYRHIDTIEHGSGTSKKVIAQEVEAVYPYAVKQTVNEIPDIYKFATINNGLVRVANTLKKGENVKLIFSGRTELAAVLEADATSFKVALKDDGQVFVYGRQVSDFRTVDYEALTTLNISATQELVRKMEALEKSSTSVLQKLEALSAEVEQLKTAGAGTVTSR